MDTLTDQHRRGEQAMSVPLLQLIGSRQPAWVPPSTHLRVALTKMSDAKVGSLVICEQMGKPLGIVTHADLVDRVILPERSLDTAVGEIMTPDPQMLSADATAYDAALLMADQGIRHVLVVDHKQRLLGVVSERDLFAIQRVGLAQLRRSIDRATQIEALARCASDIRDLAMHMQQQGLSVDQLTQFISRLNDALTRRIIRLRQMASAWPEGIGWCWLAFGSEGRDEQTLSTDQDNGLIFVVDEAHDREAVRSQLLLIARAINEDLDRCGFPLCKGDVMASNPKWCLTLSEWKQQFASWVTEPVPEALLNSSIFFDFRALAGDAELAGTLRDYLLQLTQNQPAFLRAMAMNALDVSPPLLWFGRLNPNLEANHPGVLNLKTYGARLVTDAARIFALAEGVAATHSAERLRALSGNNEHNEIAAAIRAFTLIQSLRVQHQCRLMAAGLPPDNLLPLKTLNPLDVQLLTAAMRQIKALQLRLRLQYQLK